MTTQHALETGEGEYMSVPSGISEVALIKHCAVSNANLLDRRSGGIRAQGRRVVAHSDISADRRLKAQVNERINAKGSSFEGCGPQVPTLETSERRRSPGSCGQPAHAQLDPHPTWSLALPCSIQYAGMYAQCT